MRDTLQVAVDRLYEIVNELDAAVATLDELASDLDYNEVSRPQAADRLLERLAVLRNERDVLEDVAAMLEEQRDAQS